MSDIQSHNIHSLAKVLESAQSGYAPKGLGDRALPHSQAQALTLTIVSTSNKVLVLQAQNSSQRISLEREALQGLHPKAVLQSGDKLILVSNSERQATFRLEQKAAPSIKSLSAPVLQALSQQWPDIATSTLKKAMPGILNQIQLSANSPALRNITSNIIDIANKTGQPILSLQLNAKVSSISANTFTLSLQSAKNQPLVNIKLPFNVELINKLSTDSAVNLTLDANSKKGLLVDFNISNQAPISKDTLKQFNQYLNIKSQVIKPLIAQLVVNEQVNKPKVGLVLAADKSNLNMLDSGIKQHLLKNVSAIELENAKITLSATGQNTNTAGQTNAKLHLSLLAKPILLNITPDKLMKILPPSSNAAAQAAEGVSWSSQSSDENGTQNAENKLLNNAAILKTSSDGLLQQLSKLIKQSLIQKDPGLINNVDANKFALNHTLGNLQKMIAGELNQTLPHSMSMSKTIPALSTQLLNMRSAASTELKQLIDSTLSQISAAQQDDITSDVALETDVNLPTPQQIKHIFASPILPNASVNPIQGIANSGGLINGLVTMLQASLQAKLLAQQPQLLSQMQSILPNIAHAKGSGPQQLSAKTLQELNRADPRGNLIGEINKVLSNHSMHKLAAAEVSLQSQDSFYYALPNMFSPQHKDIEIVIRREQSDNHQAKQNDTGTQWQLNMKLDIGESGEVLAKIKLINNNVDLNLYASNQALKDKILKFMPYLNKRLVALGLNVQQQCYVGKIPDKLYKTDFQVVQAYV